MIGRDSEPMQHQEQTAVRPDGPTSLHCFPLSPSSFNQAPSHSLSFTYLLASFLVTATFWLAEHRRSFPQGEENVNLLSYLNGEQDCHSGLQMIREITLHFSPLQTCLPSFSSWMFMLFVTDDWWGDAEFTPVTGHFQITYSFLRTGISFVSWRDLSFGGWAVAMQGQLPIPDRASAGWRQWCGE